MSHGREHAGRTVRKAIRIRATPQDVWNAWARARDIAQWFVNRCEGDMRTGDTVTWCFDEFEYRIPIEVFEAAEGRYLAFGGEAPGRPPALQEVELEQDGGWTILRLANSGFGEGAQWDEEYEGVDSGWDMALATLKVWLEEHAGEARTHALAMRPARFEYAALQPLYETRAGLESWLAESAELSDPELRAGTRVRLRLAGGGELSGECLVRTRTEALLSWPERRGVLGLKCFSMGPQRMVALHFNGWGLPPDARGELSARLERWLDALVPRIPAPVA